ncbi:hypothetical protein ABEB36_012648 [Hypothenemus hampei]|uniref:Major facilitator superfamily (MFS) profile domain-containing protein n=1 Tax=Hypothenemus hampei TaxID=57062 RepID=A0ABD1ECK8_HYPHA
MNLLYVLFFLDMLNLAVFLPVFSAFIRSLGGTPFNVGLINSSAAFISLLWNPIVGSLSDQIGRKGLLVNCIVASAIGSIIMAFAPSLIFVFIGRLIGSLGASVGILLRSIVGDTFKSPEEKKTFFSKSAPFMSAAFLIGSVSSGFLSEARYGFSLVFLLGATISTITAVVAKYGLPNDKKSGGKGKRKNNPSIVRKSLKELKRAVLDLKSISWARYKTLFIVKAGHDFGLTILTSNIGLIMINEFDIKGRYLGLVFLLISLVSLTTHILKLKLKSIFDKYSQIQLIIRGCLLMIVSLFGISIVRNQILFFIFFSIFGVSRPILETAFTELISSRAQEDDRGKVLGAFENLFPLASFVVPVCSGFLAEIYGERSVTLFAIVPLTMSILVAKFSRIKQD